LRWEKGLKDFHNLNQILTKRTVTVDKRKVEMRNAPLFRFVKGMHAIHIKFSFSEMAPESTVSLQKGKGRKRVLRDVVLPTKYPHRRTIKKVKYDDIQSLMKFLTPAHQTFYCSLKSDGTENNEEVEDIDCELEDESVL
jgi:hypothetical protein